MSSRRILVVGATGKQGGALIRAGLAPDASDFHFIALTRNVASPAAQELAKLGERVTVVSADLDHVESVRKVFRDEKTNGGIWGVFLVLAYPGLGADASGEERQGKVGFAW